MFFVLSGFLIGGILLDARGSSRFFSTFYARRALRIFPLYYLTLVLYFVGLAMVGPEAPSWRLFENPIPHWAFWFYARAELYDDGVQHVRPRLAWPEPGRSPSRSSSTLLASRSRASGVATNAVAHLLDRVRRRLASARRHRKTPADLADGRLYVLLPARMDTLAAGVIVAYALRYRRDFIDRLRSWWPRLAVGLGFAWAAYPYFPHTYSIRLAVIDHTVNALLFALVLLSLVILPAGRISRFLSIWLDA